MKSEAMERLKQIRTFLLDLDGTFYLGESILPGSLAFVKRVREMGGEFIFVTNNSSKNATYYAAKITGMGVPIVERQVFTSGEATRYYLAGNGFGNELRVFGTPELEAEFKAAGYRTDSMNPAAAILGFDTAMTYERLKELAFLVRRGVPFIATHPDLNCPTPEGPIPDCGALTAAIEASTGVAPKVIGKPHPEMVGALCAKFDLDPRAVAMVGDRLYTDIAMGRAAGILSILVLSGETTESDLAGSPYQPDLMFRDLGELAENLV